MSQKLDSFDNRAVEVKKTLTANKGLAPSDDTAPASGLMTRTALKGVILDDMKAAVRQLDAIRAGSKDRRALDLTFGQYVQEKWGFASADANGLDAFYAALDINPSHATVEQLMTMPEFEEGYRWIVPEIVREAVRLGIKRDPIYPNLIAGEETVTQPRVTMPSINRADATARKIGEAESIPTGTITFNQKSVSLYKLGIGIKITDEVQKFSSLNILALFLQDVGVSLNIAQTTHAIDTLINGDESSISAPVIGVSKIYNPADPTSGIQYRDLLRAWIRLGRMGRMPNTMLSNEEPALDILELKEFKSFAGGTRADTKINVRTPVPTSQNYFIHGAMVDPDQIMMLDSTSALLKLNASALRVESERIADKQVNGSYVTLMTGYANLFEDSRLIIDRSLDFATNGFPDFLNIDETALMAYTAR